MVDPFLALVNWVEKGEAPDSILAEGGVGAPPTRTRPLCPFPSTAIYNGTGSTDDARNFHCGGDLETRAAICGDLRTKYKHENGDRLDVSGVDGDDAQCAIAAAHHDRDDREFGDDRDDRGKDFDEARDNDLDRD